MNKIELHYVVSLVWQCLCEFKCILSARELRSYYYQTRIFTANYLIFIVTCLMFKHLQEHLNLSCKMYLTQ